MNKFIVALAASEMQTVGRALMNQDSNATGKDDAFGKVLVLGGTALTLFSDKDEKGFKAVLTHVRDTIDAYLNEPTP